MFPLWVGLVVSRKWLSGSFYMACRRVVRSQGWNFLDACTQRTRSRHFPQRPKTQGIKNGEKQLNMLHNLETTEEWGTTCWCTTLVRILWNYKGTNSWPSQHTFRNVLHNTVDWAASLPGCEISPDIPTSSRLSVFLTNVSILVAVDAKYACTVSKNSFQCKLPGRTCPGGT